MCVQFVTGKWWSLCSGGHAVHSQEKVFPNSPCQLMNSKQKRRENKANLSPWCLQSSAESGRLSGALEKHAFILSVKADWFALMDKANVSNGFLISIIPDRHLKSTSKCTFLLSFPVDKNSLNTVVHVQACVCQHWEMNCDSLIFLCSILRCIS